MPVTGVDTLMYRDTKFGAPTPSLKDRYLASRTKGMYNVMHCGYVWLPDIMAPHGHFSGVIFSDRPTLHFDKNATGNTTVSCMQCWMQTSGLVITSANDVPPVEDGIYHLSDCAYGVTGSTNDLIAWNFKYLYMSCSLS